MTASSPPAAEAGTPLRRGAGRAVTGPSGHPDAVSLVAAGVALGIALLGPRLVEGTDPFGVDPYSVRIGAVSVALVALALVLPALRPALAVQLAVAAVAIPFVVWSGTPWVLGRVWGDALGFRTQVLLANLAYLAAATALAVLAVRAAGIDAVRALRLRLHGRAAAATVVTIVLMVLIFLAVPATAVGRLAVPLAVLRRDLPLLGPAYCLQAAAQEIAFRGALLRLLERGLAPWVANLGQALLFGLAHIAVTYEGPTDTLIPITVALGFGFGLVTQRTGSIWPAIVAHAVLEVGQAYGVLPGLYGL